MDNPDITPADKAAIEKKLQLIEIEQATMTANRVVELCFNQCAKSFRSKKLDKAESDCIEKCSYKFIEATNRIATRFQEIQALDAANGTV